VIRKFTHNGQVILDLNGKTFLALRLFGDFNYRGEAETIHFAQLAGRSTLTKDDLADKKHILIRSRAGGRRVWTIYRRDLANYETVAKAARWFFVGPTEAGAWFLTLRHLVGRHGLGESITAEQIRQKAQEMAQDPKPHAYKLGIRAAEILPDHAAGQNGVLIHWAPDEGNCGKGNVMRFFGIEEEQNNGQ